MADIKQPTTPESWGLHRSAKEILAENETLRAQADALAEAVDEADTIIMRLERDYAIEHTMYDGRPVEKWNNKSRRALAAHREGK